MAATIKDMITDGPAFSAEAAAVRMNRPAPMMAPTPRATRLLAVKVRLRWLSLACARSTASDFLRVRLIGSSQSIRVQPSRLASRRLTLHWPLTYASVKKLIPRDSLKRIEAGCARFGEDGMGLGS